MSIEDILRPELFVTQIACVRQTNKMRFYVSSNITAAVIGGVVTSQTAPESIDLLIKVLN